MGYHALDFIADDGRFGGFGTPDDTG